MAEEQLLVLPLLGAGVGSAGSHARVHARWRPDTRTVGQKDGTHTSPALALGGRPPPHKSMTETPRSTVIPKFKAL